MAWQMMFEGKRVLITGGMGFIGSHLARRLVDLGADVTIADIQDPHSGANRHNIAEIESRVNLVIADVTDETGLPSWLHGQDFLFGLAGQTSHLGSMQDPMQDLKVNTFAQVAILEWCRKHNPAIRAVFAGTRQVYGRPNSHPVNEAHPANPTDFNGISKLAGDLYHVVCHQVYGLWTCVLRLTNVYGPHMRIKDARQTFLGWWLRQLLDGQELTIFGDGSQIRDLNYVADVVEALLLCVARPAAQGQIYNLGGEPTRLLDLARLMVKVNGGGGYKLTPFPEERRMIDIGDYSGDYSKIRRELGWQPVIPFEEGIERALKFYRLHRDHYL